MPDVQTVQGALDAQELGIVLAHEHVRFRDEAVAENWPGRYDEQLELDAALLAVRDAKERGVQTIVEPTAMFGGRDVRFMKTCMAGFGLKADKDGGVGTYDFGRVWFEN